MKYKVIKDFIDTADQMHHYLKGETYPRKGKATAERVAVLISNKNRTGAALIEEVKDGE
ncbi:hypothetical protein J3A84_04870 [Proteiniclasticum sp. SCR006]|uniref:Uncharacterized protein n=1 Tax=Proteiniclasticum aestuarii TaxID=2817862 RepID=A0A939KIQ0_9CLOT|nr:hypothetical protein [Proteiniclasticum aestuarii]MBO1264373.1 hypothetical protein [Proteiniclasticum aestuarii]